MRPENMRFRDFAVCLKAAANETERAGFRETGSYLLYFLLKTFENNRDRTEVVFIDSDFRPIKTISIGKKRFLDLDKFSSFADEESERCQAEYVIIFRNIREGNFKVEFSHSNALFNRLKKVKLYDYVLKTDEMYKSMMSGFR